MAISNLFSDGSNTNNTGVKEHQNSSMVNNGSSQKDNLKNTDANNANEVISKNKDEQQTKIIDFSTFSSEDVSAYIVFKRFKYKRGRNDSHTDYVPDKDEGIISEAVGTVANWISSARTWDESDYKGAIVLPLQNPIMHDYGVSWGMFNSPLTDIGASLAAAGASVAGDVLLGYAKANMNGPNISGGGALQNAAGTALSNNAGAIGQYVANVSANEAGQIFNPDSELVLQAINMRNHQFEFTMTPRNAQEQQMIKDAIRAFKIGMLPRKSGMKVFGSSTNLSYPDEWVIHFIDGRHNRIGQPLDIPHIPDCALVNVMVMYNPQGHHFHVDGSPVQYRISLQFAEHTTLTGDDIENGNY